MNNRLKIVLLPMLLPPVYWLAAWPLAAFVYGVLFGGIAVYLLMRPAVRRRDSEPANFPPPSACRGRGDDPVVRMLLDRWVRRDDKPYLTTGLTLHEVARMTGLGKRRISSYLNTCLDTNFKSWITRLRVQEVERMLSDGSGPRSLTQIAEQTGFSDLAAMSNAFHKATGFTPSHFREKAAAESGK